MTGTPNAEVESSFDYTEWQREYFGKKSLQQIDEELDEYFSHHASKSGNARII